ncbi:MAG: ATP-binding protein [Gammaproteobacteria bacterium]
MNRIDFEIAMHDKSKAKIDERKLHDKGTDLSLLIQQAPVRIAMFDREMRYLAASNRWKEEYKLPIDISIIGQSHYEIFPEIPERWKDVHSRGLAGESLSADEDRFERSDGSIQWDKWTMQPWYNLDGSVGGILVATEDVTERVLAKKALQESRADLDRAQVVGQIGSWRLDVIRNVLTWSDETYRIFGVTKGTPLTYETFLGIVHPEDREYVEMMWEAGLRREPYDIEHRIVANGQVKWVREKAYLEFNDAGELLGGFGIAQDITSRKQAELALQEADRRKDEFLAMLAHELRNPLASILTAAQVLRLVGSKEPALDRASGIIEKQVNQLAHLVDDLLDISRICSGKIQLQNEILDLAEVIRQAVETNQPLVEARNHKLSLTLPSKPVRVEGDFTRLVQVVGNLLNNAAKYTGHGGMISVSVEQGDGSSDTRNNVLIRVHDNGRGIDPESLTSLFDMFFQVKRNLDRSEGGLGIGLSLVKSLVELHGGWVNVHSAGLGAGSEFTVGLPCLPDKPLRSYVEVSSPVHAVNRQRILLVEDNLDVADSLSLLLTIYGHEVLLAHNGKEAVEIALRERPAVVLMDIGLPCMDGYQACRAMRNEGLTDTLIVAVTGYGQESDRQKAEEAGFDRYLIKPLDPQTITDLLAFLPVRH